MFHLTDDHHQRHDLRQELGRKGTMATPATRERITAAIAVILDAGAESGALRAHVEPKEVTMMLLGVFLPTTADNSPELTGRLLDLVVDSLRPAAQGPSRA
ncbi:hypothetical protein ACFWFI_08105 [Streptomyces sp. NPDC060209]|uniref:SbtR family transcriptional regulator n=1 Tax=Streptomyces sp. NPDC060209 TaxID=3347073 RepID=UPI0036677489